MQKNQAAALALMLTIPDDFVPVVILTLAEMVVSIGKKEIPLEALPKDAHDLVIQTCYSVMQVNKGRKQAKEEAEAAILKAMTGDSNDRER